MTVTIEVDGIVSRMLGGGFRTNHFASIKVDECNSGWKESDHATCFMKDAMVWKAAPYDKFGQERLPLNKEGLG